MRSADSFQVKMEECARLDVNFVRSKATPLRRLGIALLSISPSLLRAAIGMTRDRVNEAAP